MKFVSGMFSESGEVSEMRVLALICVLVASGIAIYGMNKTPVDYEGLSLLCGTFLGSGITGKVFQKVSEVKSAKGTVTKTLEQKDV